MLAKATLRMPAEWEPHVATWLAWPHNEEDWPGKFEPIPWAFAEIIRHLTVGERVRLLVRNSRAEREARDYLKRAGVALGKVDFLSVPTDRGWMRDCGAIYVFEGKKKCALDWRFTGWAKYANHKKDDKVPQKIAARFKAPRIAPTYNGKRIVLEGGSIDVNGKGTLITTEECLLSKKQQRNPDLSRNDYEKIFEQYLGIKEVIWLNRGIAGDDTHGHVDDITRFVNANTVVTAMEKNKRDENFEPLQENLKRLKHARLENGKRLNVVELPMPKPVVFEGQRLPASYANFLIANSCVLVPTFNDPNDRIALSILAQLFPKRDIIGIHAVDLVWGLGTIHCMSQQEPA